MNTTRAIGLILLILGILAVIYGGFTYTAETHDAEIGPIEVEVEDREHVEIPLWAGVVAIVAGGGLLVFGGRRAAALR